MRLKNYLEEMAMPRAQDIEKTYYHGTWQDRYAKRIMKEGIQPPDLSIGKKNMFTPVKGKVYITPNIEYALIYALGANMIGSDSIMPGWKMEGAKYMWIFVIAGTELLDIEPDEDAVGEMVYNQTPSWLVSLAKSKLTSNQYQKVMDGEYKYWAATGKKLNKIMSDKQKLELIGIAGGGMQGAIAHAGALKPKETWKMLKTDNYKLKTNGSNFFKIAKKVK